MSSAPRAVIFGLSGPRLTQAEKTFLAQAQPWGTILFARNIEDPAQVRGLTAELRDATGRDLPILIDQEGGRVQRMTPPHWRSWVPALQQCTHAQDPARAMYLRGRLIARDLRDIGINVNCAPLADIATAQTHAVLKNRCYGTTLAAVVTHARAMAQGLSAGGVLPVLKHIPGHGRAALDSHLELPHVSNAPDLLHETDFAAFRALKDLPLGMSAHIVFDQIDPSGPATTSPIMIDLIRRQIGFEGLLMTDDISMRALFGPVGRRAQAALAAGCDLVLHCNGHLDEMRALADVCPPLTGAACQRDAYAQGLRNMFEDADISALEAEYDLLMTT